MVYFPPDTSPSSNHGDWDSEDSVDGIADQEPLNISWVSVVEHSVGVCSLPGNRYGSSRRSLVADIETMKNEGVTDVFVVATEAELRGCRVPSMMVEYLQRGFQANQYPLSIDTVPDMELLMRLLQELREALANGRKPLVHCVDGLGRSCLVLAVLSLFLNPDLPPVVAIDNLRRVRGPAAITTIKQYHFIMDFQKSLADFLQIRNNSPQTTS